MSLNKKRNRIDKLHRFLLVVYYKPPKLAMYYGEVARRLLRMYGKKYPVEFVLAGYNRKRKKLFWNVIIRTYGDEEE